LSFSDNYSDRYSNIDAEVFDNKIIILKKVKSLRQLRRTEKELVRLCYKEAIIKGFALKGVQQYIASKTKIWIEWSCLEYLKKAEEQENREWYLRLAKDHFAYIGIHRNMIDELQQIKNGLWEIIMNPKSEPSVKISAAKEIHAISKTKTLILRDLPFITQLSTFYDTSKLDKHFLDKTNTSSISPISNKKKMLTHNLKESGLEDDFNITNQFNYDNSENSPTDDTTANASNEYQNLNDDMVKTILSDFHGSDHLKGINIEELTEEKMNNLISPQKWETIKKLKELEDDSIEMMIIRKFFKFHQRKNL
jgi:hypothetical protein